MSRPPALGAVAACLLLTACAPQAAHQVRSTPTPTPTPLAFGVLPLGGVTAAPIPIAPPYRAAADLGPLPLTVRAARVPANPQVALGDLASALGVPGPPIAFGGGLAYNLGSTTGYQLTSASGLLNFNFHPNTPVDETGATPTVASAVSFVERFLAGHHLLGPNSGLTPLPQLTNAHAADRRVFFQWTQDGYPLVTISGQAEEIYADVAANYRDQLSLVGISGAVPEPILGATATYPAISIRLLVKDLNQGQLSPNSYLLQAGGQPWVGASPAASAASTPALLTAARLAVVDSDGYAVPVLVLQVSGRSPVSEFVMCAAATNACAPLRYSTPAPSSAASPAT